VPTNTKKASPIYAVLGLGALAYGALLALGINVAKNLTGNAAFPNPPVDLTAFSALLSSFSASIAAALEGGKNAKAVRDKDRKLIIQDLKALALYVQNNCNDDMTIFTTSGFTAKASTKTAGQPVAIPTIKSLDYGLLPGELTASIKSVTGAKAYNIRYAPLTGGLPGPWTTVQVAVIKKPTTFSNLTRGTDYAFQVQALGSVGLTDWSDSATIMCT